MGMLKTTCIFSQCNCQNSTYLWSWCILPSKSFCRGQMSHPHLNISYFQYIPFKKPHLPRHTTCGLTPTRRNLPILYRQTLQTYNSLMATKPNRYIDSDILALPFSVSSHCFVTRCPTTCRASDCPYIQITLSTLCQCFLLLGDSYLLTVFFLWEHLFYLIRLKLEWFIIFWGLNELLFTPGML